MDRILYTDIDLTVLDFNGPFEDYLVSQGVNIPAPGHLEGHCRLSEAIDVSVEEEAMFVAEFFRSDYYYRLPPLEGAADAVQRLHEEGWSFVAISACPDEESVLEGRKTNLEAALGVPFLAVHSTGIGGCKKEVLKGFTPSIWVEDHYLNAVAGHELGYRTFLVNQKHNQHHDAPMTRVDSWKEIVGHLCMENSRS